MAPKPDAKPPEPDEDYDSDTDESVAHLFDDEAFTDEREGARGQRHKTILESIGDTLKSAGETASRYTQLGVAHAELQKLRFDLRRAYGKLGEATMRCWDHHAELAITLDDPELKVSLAAVREARKNIRAKQVQIAKLKHQG